MPTARLLAAVVSTLVSTSFASAFTYQDDYQEYLEIKEEISRLTGSIYRTPDFIAYEQEYHEAIGSFDGGWPVDINTYHKQIDSHQIVLVSDYHGSQRDQQKFIKILDRMSADPRPLTVVFEWIDQKYQKILNQYVNGTISVGYVEDTIAADESWPFNLSGYFKTLFATRGKAHSILLAERLDGDYDLKTRDQTIAEAIAKHQKLNPNNRYLVFYGAYHLLGTDHLQEQIQKLGFKTPLVVTSYGDDFFWSLYKTLGEVAPFISLDEHTVFATSDTPLEMSKQELRQVIKETPPPPEDWDLDNFEEFASAAPNP